MSIQRMIRAGAIPEIAIQHGCAYSVGILYARAMFGGHEEAV